MKHNIHKFPFPILTAALLLSACSPSTSPTLPERLPRTAALTETQTVEETDSAAGNGRDALLPAEQSGEALTADPETQSGPELQDTADASADNPAEESFETGESLPEGSEPGTDGSPLSSVPEDPALPAETNPPAGMTDPAAEAVVPADPNAIIDLSTALYTYGKMMADLDYLQACYPGLISLDSAGTTHDGRTIPVVRFGNPSAEHTFLIAASTHAREYMTTQLVMKQLEYYCASFETASYSGASYRDLFSDLCIVLVPMVNPDGVTISQYGPEGLNRQDLKDNLNSIYASDVNGGFTDLDAASYFSRWKANAVGVDLNRNYSPGWDTLSDRPVPSSSLYGGSEPFSEPETQALIRLVESLPNLELVISYHSYGDLVYWQYGQEEPMWTINANLATHISNLTGSAMAGYSNEAGFSNWCVLEKEIPSVTVETGTVPCPLPIEQFAPIWEQHRQIWAMLSYLY